MIFTESGEYVSIDESKVSDSIVNSIEFNLKDLKITKKELENETGEKFNPTEMNKTLYKIKSTSSAIIKYISSGLTSIAIADTSSGIINNIKSKGMISKSSILPERYIFNAIQIICGLLLKILSKAIKKTNEKATVESAKSIVKDLEKMLDKTKDPGIVEYLTNKIGTLNNLIENYDKEANKK